MYGKIHRSIYNGTLRGRKEELAVFQYLIVQADKDGWVDVHPSKISDDTGFSVTDVTQALKNLEKPDPQSRSKHLNGCRLERMDAHRDWGWRIVNHDYYRKLRNEEEKRENNRLRQKRFRDSKKQQQQENNTNVTHHNAPVTAVTKNNDIAEAEAEVHTEEKILSVKPPVLTKYDCTKFNEFWDIYPRKVNKKKTYNAWKNKNLSLIADKILESLPQHIVEWNEREGKKYIPHPLTWINGECWEDDLNCSIKKKTRMEKILRERKEREANYGLNGS